MIKLKYFNEKGLVEVPIHINHFPAGERVVEFNVSECKTDEFFNIIWEFQDDYELFLIVQIVDKIRAELKKSRISLVALYMPHSRMDRFMGDKAFSLHSFSKIINMCNFQNVLTLDIHSDVSIKLLNAIFNVHPTRSFDLNDEIEEFAKDHDIDLLSFHRQQKIIIVCPDQGAKPRALEFSNFLDMNKIIYANKKRGADGSIIETQIEEVNFDVKDDDILLIVDDICDGGGTFIGLANELNKLYPNTQKWLHTTHGIYSKGKKVLLEHFDVVNCSNDLSNIK